MTRFKLAENPMIEGDEICIVHMLQPIAIIRCIEGFVTSENKLYKHFTYRNTDGFLEEWTLAVHHFMTTDFITEPEKQATPLLERAWRWYRAYLEWEDKNIDNGTI